jgi:hypothetical protein
MKTCEDCGERVYSLGCTNCNEVAYIEAGECYDPPPCAACEIKAVVGDEYGHAHTCGDVPLPEPPK